VRYHKGGRCFSSLALPDNAPTIFDFNISFYLGFFK